MFGVAIIPLARALHSHLADASALLADISAVFAYVWTGSAELGVIHDAGSVSTSRHYHPAVLPMDGTSG